MFVKLDHFPKVQGENKKSLKPPTRYGDMNMPKSLFPKLQVPSIKSNSRCSSLRCCNCWSGSEPCRNSAWRIVPAFGVMGRWTGAPQRTDEVKGWVFIAKNSIPKYHPQKKCHQTSQVMFCKSYDRFRIRSWDFGIPNLSKVQWFPTEKVKQVPRPLGI